MPYLPSFMVDALLIGNTYESVLWWYVLTTSLNNCAICLLGIGAGTNALNGMLRFGLLMLGVFSVSPFHLYGFLYFGTLKSWLLHQEASDPWLLWSRSCSATVPAAPCSLPVRAVSGAVLSLARYRGLSLSRPIERPRSLVRSMLVVVSLFALSFAALKCIQPYPHLCFEYFPNWLDHALGRHPHEMYYRGLIVESVPLVVTAFVAVWATLGERISIWRMGCFAVLCPAIQNVEVILYRFV